MGNLERHPYKSLKEKGKMSKVMMKMMMKINPKGRNLWLSSLRHKKDRRLQFFYLKVKKSLKKVATLPTYKTQRRVTRQGSKVATPISAKRKKGIVKTIKLENGKSPKKGKSKAKEIEEENHFQT